MATNKPRPVSASRRRFLIGGIVAAGVATPVYAKGVEPTWLRVADLEVPIAGWPVEADGLRVGQLSDLHCDTEADARRVLRAAKLLMEQKPDIVFVTGDYLTRHPVAPKVAACLEGLRPLLAAPRGVFAVLGNHDYWSGATEAIARGMHREGFTLLQNSAVPLPGTPSVWLVGLDDCFDKHHSVARALRHVPKDATKLLLVHEPDYADEAPAGFALQFSGHSHGGQVRIPGVRPLHLPWLGRHYYEGLCQGPNHPVYVTRGVGMVYPKLRFCCPPEVALIRIVGKAKEG